MRSWLNQGVEVFTPYGATECMPTCIIGSNEVLATRAATDAGAGICVGKPFAGVDVRIIDVSDQPIDYLSDAKQMDVGQIGEIVVHGPTVTRGYYNNDQATRLAKMKDEQGRLYHRMGDVGCMDEQGRLWFCGRIVHIVDTPAQRLYSVPIEGVFNAHTEVFRSALVRVGAQGSARPVICIELESTANQSSWPRIRAELLALAQQHDQTALLKDFLLHPGFPVDIRHNSKIERSLLGDWATKRLS
jgi:acyl-CoA synthetase (AMP-forming)/AMP-acid ligase II